MHLTGIEPVSFKALIWICSKQNEETTRLRQHIKNNIVFTNINLILVWFILVTEM